MGKTPEKSKKATETKRRCKNCDSPFGPKREWQDFCSGNCRKEYWRHGGVSIRRIMPTIEARVREIVSPLEAELRELAKRLPAAER
jgi:hypothetical protein